MTGTSVLSRKRDVVRSDLARVAIDLFGRQGFDSVTVDDVARAAGISARTFFRYFSSKDDIVLDLVTRLQGRLVVAFDARPAKESAVEALRRAFAATSAVAEEDRVWVLSIGRILKSSPALRMASYGRPWVDGAPLVERVAARMGTDAGDPRARIVVAAMTAVATTEWYAWIDADGAGDPDERIVSALEALEAGLAALETGRRPGRRRRTFSA